MRCKMKERKKRQQYDDVFKAKVAIEAIKGELTLAELVSKYQVQSGQILQWKKRLIEEAPDMFSRKQDPEIGILKQERERLFNRIGQQTMEIEFLKKNCEKLGLL